MNDKWYKIRRCILLFITRFILKIPKYEKFPIWILWIFYPLETWSSKYAGVYIDYLKFTVRINNIEIPLELLDNIKNETYNYECYYNFKKDDDGILKIYRRTFVKSEINE
jgi:hypothetical protein